MIIRTSSPHTLPSPARGEEKKKGTLKREQHAKPSPLAGKGKTRIPPPWQERVNLYSLPPGGGGLGWGGVALHQYPRKQDSNLAEILNLLQFSMPPGLGHEGDFQAPGG